MAAETFYSALHWAKKAEASAKLAADLAQTEGKVIQLGFDGSMQDGQLVFKHAPGGVEVPYQLVDDVEYELDLAYNGDLDSLTTMVVKNGSDTISFVSALHRSSTEPARVADMDAVMRYDATTGYRWLFKATYKIAPNGAKVFLLYPVVAAKDYSDKTNCITEIPQDIKLELNNGVMTLKAGSKVYVPNGIGVFDEVVVSADKTLGTVGTYTGSSLLFFDTVSGNLNQAVTNYSGATAPTSGDGNWYDTTNNFVRIYSNGVVNQSSKLSLPIAMVTRTNGSWTSIDQVFNGFGYIGSTVFALPGVKGLIPDGRNEDGTLKNIEVTLDKVATMNTLNNYNQAVNLYSGGALSVFGFEGIFSQTTPPTRAGNNLWYNPETNYWKYTENGGSTWNPVQLIPVADASTTTTITSFQPKFPFHAVDRNDSSWVSAQAMPSGKYINLTLGASGTKYTAPANGWFTVSAWTTATATSYIHLVNTSNELAILLVPNQGSGYQQRCFVPAKKGDVVKLVYGNLDTSRSNFKFIYAEGEN